MTYETLGGAHRSMDLSNKEGKDSQIRKAVSFTLEPVVLEQLCKRARKHHLSDSREVENILRKAFRL